jgi:lipid-A-disaccharide synthase-like uncharacterized protein
MKKLLQRDILSVAFVASIIVFGSSLVFLLALDLSSRGRLIFILFAVASFFSSLSLILQIKERRKKVVDQKS